MPSWKPKRNGPAPGRILTPEEEFVLARLDGRLSTGDIAALAGIEKERVERIVGTLAGQGLIEEADAGTPISAGKVPEAVPAEGRFNPGFGPEGEVAEEREPPILVPDDEVPDGEKPARPASRPPRDEKNTLNYQRMYESEYRRLERAARVEKATHAASGHLMALCLDPEPQVIAAIFQNPTAGLDQARMAARHHKTPQGLEFIVKRSEFVHDTQVHRALVRNEMMSESLMRRVLAVKRLADVYRIAIDRDVPERNRVWARADLRTKWNQSPAEDRADLVISTEARCLALLGGLTFDARTASILAGRPYSSLLFVQNLARFPACPPPLLAHLIKQPLVRRNPALRKLLLQHPSLPHELKRPF